MLSDKAAVIPTPLHLATQQRDICVQFAQERLDAADWDSGREGIHTVSGSVFFLHVDAKPVSSVLHLSQSSSGESFNFSWKYKGAAKRWPGSLATFAQPQPCAQSCTIHKNTLPNSQTHQIIYLSRGSCHNSAARPIQPSHLTTATKKWGLTGKGSREEAFRGHFSMSRCIGLKFSSI